MTFTDAELTASTNRAFPVPQRVTMDSDGEVLMKEYTKMMTDMILLCATLALSLFFWVISLTISTYYGESASFFFPLTSGKRVFFFFLMPDKMMEVSRFKSICDISGKKELISFLKSFTPFSLVMNTFSAHLLDLGSF